MSQLPKSNPYLKTKVMTASSEELRLMLFDGGIKFCRVAEDALGKDRFEDSYNAMMRAQKIVLELSVSLNYDVDPDLCSKMASLYMYIYKLLVDANLNREVQPLREAIGLLEYERETWQMLINKVNKDSVNGSAPRRVNLPGTNPIAKLGPGGQSGVESGGSGLGGLSISG